MNIKWRIRNFRQGDRQRPATGKIGVYASGVAATTGSEPGSQL